MSAACAPGSGSDTMEGVLAAILESGDPERLYTGLSLLVSAASAGEEARGAARRSARCGALLDPELEARARPRRTSSTAEREPFARTLVELRAAAAELPNCRIWACAAAVQATGRRRRRAPRRRDLDPELPARGRGRAARRRMKRARRAARRAAARRLRRPRGRPVRGQALRRGPQRQPHARRLRRRLRHLQRRASRAAAEPAAARPPAHARPVACRPS